MIYHPAKLLIKRIVAVILFRSGVMQLLERQRFKENAAVLMYHRVLPSEQIAKSPSHPGIIIERRTFENQLAFLKDQFCPLSVDEFGYYYRHQKPFPPKSFLLTFDDGWVDNFKTALPILTKLQIPALIFLPTDYIGTSRYFWQERLRNALTSLFAKHSGWVEPVLATDWEPPLKNRLVEMLRSPEKIFRDALPDAINVLKSRSVDQIQKNIEIIENYIQTDNGTPLPEQHFIDWEMVRRMKSSGLVDFGSHGCSHQLMTLKETDPDQEAIKSKEIIENQIGAPVVTFSYPNGNYNSDCIQAVRNAGYQLAFTTQAGMADTSANPYEIKRINIHQSATITRPLFYGRLLNIW